MTSPLDPPLTTLRELVARALAEDLGPLGDLTSALIPADTLVTAHLRSRATGVMAGRLSAEETFRAVDPSIDMKWWKADGDRLEPGTVLADIYGPLTSVLTAERTALNFLCHLSGVATMTARFVEAAREGRPGVRVWDTRKTLPGLRAVEKAAVRAGGGVNHRGSLSEMVLVKDNHLAGIGIAEAVGRARALWPGRGVEVECDRLEQVAEAIEAGADLVLLDNMTPEQVKGCVAEVAGRALVEVSGGVTLDTVASYAAAGADLISTSIITQSAPAFDIGLDLPA
ncbi:MAG TPA: carboxylating nicotinate-nucleotide diphosphorylase [Acidimicrobiales bacterium]